MSAANALTPLGVEIVGEDSITESYEIPVGFHRAMGAMGYGLFSQKSLTKGETLFEQAPMAHMQTLPNIHQTIVCRHCSRCMLSVETQLDLLVGDCARADVKKSNWRLPGSEIDLPFESVKKCPQGCGTLFCDENCLAEAASYHNPLCVGDIKCARTDPRFNFKVHAIETNEIMLLAGQIMADIVHRFKESGDVVSALRPVVGFACSPWWKVARKAEEYQGSQADFEALLRKQCEEGLVLLAKVFPESLDPKLAPVFSVNFFGRLIGSFEVNQFGIRVAHPVQLYVKQMMQSVDSVLQKQAAARLGIIVDKLQENEDDCEDEDEDEGGSASIFNSVEAMEALDLELDNGMKNVSKSAGGRKWASGSEGVGAGEGEVGAGEDGDQDEVMEEEWSLDTFLEYSDDLFPPLDAVGAFKVLALVNHSCAPNVRVEYHCDGRQVSVVVSVVCVGGIPLRRQAKRRPRACFCVGSVG
jgi:hypothetical protein